MGVIQFSTSLALGKLGVTSLQDRRTRVCKDVGTVRRRENKSIINQQCMLRILPEFIQSMKGVT